MSPRFPATRLQRELDEQLVESAEKGNASNVLLFLERGANPIANNSLPLYWASENGHAECVKLLLSASNPSVDTSRALSWASLHGHVECVKALLPTSQPTSRGWATALSNVVKGGHAECFRLLLSASGTLADPKNIFAQALCSGHAEIMAILLEHEPRLPGDIDLDLSRQQAQRQGFHEIATLCLALMDRCEISVSTSLPAASPMPDTTPTRPKESSKPAPRL